MKKNLKNDILNNLEVLNLKLIDNDFLLDDKIKVDAICSDKFGSLVICVVREYFIGHLLGDGIKIYDYFKQNFSDAKIRAKAKKQKITNNYIRIVIFSETFSSYDYDSVKYLPIDIELISYTRDENTSFIKKYLNTRYVKLFLKEPKYLKLALIKPLIEETKYLGDDFKVYFTEEKIFFIRINNFLTVSFEEETLIFTTGKTKIKVNTLESFEKAMRKVYEVYKRS